MRRSPALRTTVTCKPDGTVVIVVEPPPVAPWGVDRNSAGSQEARDDDEGSPGKSRASLHYLQVPLDGA
jgi:hypothetical protein